MAAKKLALKIHVIQSGQEGMTSPYGYRTDPISGAKNSFHKGVDLVRYGVGGDNILAFAAGTVTVAKDTVPGLDKVNNLGGNTIEIDHGNGYRTRYLHLKYKSLTVKVGGKVKAGQVIAVMGTTGYSTGVHLHFEVRKNGDPIDPMPYLEGKKSFSGSLPVTIPAAAKSNGIVEGASVKVNKGAKSYEGKGIAAFVYNGTYKVDSLHNDRAVLDSKGICTAFRTSDLTLSTAAAAAASTAKPAEIKVGDIVQFAGGYHYKSASAALPTGAKRKAGQGKVTGISKGAKHPYHIVPHGSKATDAYGWVDEKTVE